MRKRRNCTISSGKPAWGKGARLRTTQAEPALRSISAAGEAAGELRHSRSEPAAGAAGSRGATLSACSSRSSAPAMSTKVCSVVASLFWGCFVQHNERLLCKSTAWFLGGEEVGSEPAVRLCLIAPAVSTSLSPGDFAESCQLDFCLSLGNVHATPLPCLKAVL